MNKTYCFFSARYLPYLGGVERYTFNLARELVNRGNKVIIITSHIGDEKAYEEDGNIIVFRLESLNLLNGRFPVAKYNKDNRKIFKTIKKLSIDYVVINTRFYVLSYIGALFAKNNNISSIVIEHGTGHFTVNNKFFDFAGHIYEHAISKLVKKNVKDFYGVSLECNKWLKHFNITAKGVVYNAINEKQIFNLCKEQNTRIKETIAYNEKDIIITFTGRLIAEKGILKLIAAFKEVKDQYPNAKLCIAGDGNLFNNLLKENNTGVYMLGKLSFDNVISLLKLTTIFCLPTDYPEGLPTSVLEAIACKCYIITSAAGGAKEVILDSTYGTIMKNNDKDEIREMLLKAISDSKRRETAVEKSYERVCNKFTWQQTAEDLTKIFETV